MNRFSLLLGAPLVLALASGCTRDGKFQPVDMWNGSRLKPYENVNFFDDKRSSRTPPSGTVARGQDRLNEEVYYGTKNGTLVATNPVFAAATPQNKLALIQRGQERYNIYCQPCHGLSGYGDGMIVKRGFSKPPTYHLPRLREVSDGYLYDVIANGYGSMYSYGARVPPRDRWAIVAYIRALQTSQNATQADLPADLKPGQERVEPPIENGRRKYIGPRGGGEYSGTGPGGRGEPGTNGMNQEQGALQQGELKP